MKILAIENNKNDIFQAFWQLLLPSSARLQIEVVPIFKKYQ